MIGPYPIEKIRLIPQSMANQDLQIWFWVTVEGMHNCPLEPLTDEFWKKRKGSLLVFGTCFPKISAKERGDLLILVTQKRKPRQKDAEPLTTRQRFELYALILEIGFPQTAGMEDAPFPMMLPIFNKFELHFLEYVKPRKGKDGKYHRKPLSEADQANAMTAYLDEQGRTNCPFCKEALTEEDGFFVVERFPVDDGSILALAMCERCEESFSLIMK